MISILSLEIMYQRGPVVVGVIVCSSVDLQLTTYRSVPITADVVS